MVENGFLSSAERSDRSKEKVVAQILGSRKDDYCPLQVFLEWNGDLQMKDSNGKPYFPEAHNSSRCNDCPVYREVMQLPIPLKEIVTFELVQRIKKQESERLQFDVGLDLAFRFWNNGYSVIFDSLYGPWSNDGLDVNQLYNRVMSEK